MLTRTLERKQPAPVDVHVEATLGEAIGVTFQQVQKYEKGTNRVGASRVQQIADVLQVPVSNFFEDMPAEATNGAGGAGRPSALHPELMQFVSSDQGLALIRAFCRIEDVKVRARVVSLVKALAEQERS
ncbi:transcriptional regulator with XRE-family HTH domain [Sinorhizobium kostiense]|uniref:Transcriptional regulator with XRE-family HTH domain n=1 Tax=Sinorhizobium kostiense TaxID=76747 RepID=A0ABS4R7C8_9HYPH|nr:helix-turn-helix transcriptional regulator [Sinorhizobium kostiense]MBP2238798.1 transcriptional regulator with XRE-family HTH domain [Sinorhizobium kostiense]